MTESLWTKPSSSSSSSESSSQADKVMVGNSALEFDYKYFEVNMKHHQINNLLECSVMFLTDSPHGLRSRRTNQSLSVRNMNIQSPTISPLPSSRLGILTQRRQRVNLLLGIISHDHQNICVGLTENYLTLFPHTMTLLLTPGNPTYKPRLQPVESWHQKSILFRSRFNNLWGGLAWPMLHGRAEYSRYMTFYKFKPTNIQIIVLSGDASFVLTSLVLGEVLDIPRGWLPWSCL